ncbi:PLP-dependent transferase [Akkermansiaceae bacterium]|nr:PLP-dependent transferase [Akkermansiaceae bacterium]
MQDLLTKPLWDGTTVGRPLPDSPHAVAVSLPTWDSVIGYEEGREKVVQKLETGYPRFFLNPMVKRLFAKATGEVAEGGKRAVLFPTKDAAQRAQRYVERRINGATSIASYEDGLQALIVPEEALSVAMEYWRHTGEIVSSRQADDILNEREVEGVSSVILRQQLAETSGAALDDHFVFESGMSAIFATFRAVMDQFPSKKTLQLEFPYVDGLKIQEKFGNGAVFLHETEGEDFDAAIRRIQEGEFAAVFCETPSNPLLRCVNLARVSEACRQGGVPLVVDDTVASNINVDVLQYADLVTTSLTKWVNGKGDVMAGLVTLNENSPWVTEFRDYLSTATKGGSLLYKGDCKALISNMKDYPERVRRSNENGELVADYLAEHPAVGRVWYPKFVTPHEYQLIRRNSGGYGGLISFTLKQPRKMPRVYDALELCKGPSLGTEFSIACPYTMLAHYFELDWAEACGVSPNLLRLSVGAEDGVIIIGALARALDLG